MIMDYAKFKSVAEVEEHVSSLSPTLKNLLDIPWVGGSGQGRQLDHGQVQKMLDKASNGIISSRWQMHPCLLRLALPWTPIV